MAINWLDTLKNEGEVLHKKHDVQPMTTEQLLEMFNNQKIK